MSLVGLLTGLSLWCKTEPQCCSNLNSLSVQKLKVWNSKVRTQNQYHKHARAKGCGGPTREGTLTLHLHTRGWEKQTATKTPGQMFFNAQFTLYLNVLISSVCGTHNYLDRGIDTS